MIKFLIPIILVAFAFSCNSSSEAIHEEKESITPIDTEIKYAKNFKLHESENGYILELIDPNTGKTEQRISLSPDEKMKVISIPSTLNGMFAALGRSEQIVGVSNIDYVYDEIIRSRFADGKVKAYGDETSNSVESIVSSGASILFYDGFGKEFPNEKRIEKLGIQVIPIYDWRENHPLGKAEWLKVVGAVTGHMKEANKLFKIIEERYIDLKEIAGSSIPGPTVVCGNLIGDIWYTPSGENYFAVMIKDAGARYKYAETTGTSSLQFSIEEMIHENKTTQFWLNPGSPTKELIDNTNPHAKHLDAYQENIYCYSAEMSKFWEQSAVRPDYVLSDLIHIFHPEITSIKELYFYQNVDK